MGIDLNESEKALVKDGQLIQAIKSLRDRLGCSLLEAKHALDLHRGLVVFDEVIPQNLSEALIIMRSLFAWLYQESKGGASKENLAHAARFIKRMEEKYKLPHWDYLDEIE